MDNIALDYYGTEINFHKLVELMDQYARGFLEDGITSKDVFTIACLSTLENVISFLSLNKLQIIRNNPDFYLLKSDMDLYTSQKGSNILILFDGYAPRLLENILNSKLKKIYLVNLTDFLPDWNKNIF
jgi:hypothetical protein